MRNNQFRRQGELTDASSVSKADMVLTVPGRAHFAGTGPDGKRCIDCRYWILPYGRKKQICAEYHRITGDQSRSIPAETPSCRYFERKNA